MGDLIGKTLGPYQVLLKIRSTQTNAIYKAYHNQLGRYVALQVILPDQPHPAGLFARLKEYAGILSRLSHPNIGTLLDCEEYEGETCLAYDFAPQGILRRRFQMKMPWPSAAQTLIPVAQALAYAHQQGVIHGHIRPESILVSNEGGAVLFDFGLELLIQQEIRAVYPGGWLSGDGTCYAPPEQALGKSIDHRSDIYSLGMVLFELITGQRAYQGERAVEELVQQATAPLPAPGALAPALPPVAAQILRRAVDPNPDDRFQSMQHLATLLARAALRQPILPEMLRNPAWKPARRLRPVFMGLAGLLGAALLAGAFLLLRGGSAWAGGADPTATLPSIAAAAQATRPAEPEATPSPAPQTPPEESELTALPAPTQSAPEPTAPALPRQRQYPMLPGEPLPDDQKPILDSDTVEQALNLSMIGIGWLTDLTRTGSGDQIAVATTTGVYILSSPDYNVQQYINTAGPVLSLAFSPDGKTLATGDRDGLVRIWEIASGSEKFSLSGHLGAVRRVIYSPDGGRLISTADDRSARLWDPIGGLPVAELGAHVQPVTGAAFSPDSTTLATVSADYKIIYWSARDGAQQKIISGRTSMRDVAYSPDGALVYTVGNNRLIEAWEAGSERSLDPMGPTATPINEIEVSPDGEYLAAAESSGMVTVFSRQGEKLWASANTPMALAAPANMEAVNRVAFSADSKTISSGILDNTIRFWDAQSGQERVVVTHFSNFIQRLAVSPNSTYLAGQLVGGGVRVWSMTDAGMRFAFPGELVDGKIFSLDESFLALKEGANTVVVYSLKDGKEAYRFGGHPSIRSISFKNNGQFLAAGDASGVKIWSLSSGQEIITTSNFETRGCTTVSPLGSSPQVMVNRVHFVGFIDDTREAICNITRAGWMKAFDYRVDERHPIAATGGSSRLEVWNYQNSPKREQDAILAMEGLFGREVEHVALAPQAELVAAALDDATVRIWNFREQGAEKIRLASHLGKITALVFTPDGRYLISSSLDGTVRIWGIDPGV